MFKRLLVLAFIAIAAMSATPPAHAATLRIDNLYCLSLGHGRAECQASASGGTGSYTYTWNPTPYAGSGGYVLIYCTAYRNKTVNLTVRDSSGATVSSSTVFYCGDAV
ncbi:MAG: hypothetical protein JOZ51_29085 [Chloroflexi bacterium]|nr:hypothetical protein [Chloroflexota bacterium]